MSAHIEPIYRSVLTPVRLRPDALPPHATHAVRESCIRIYNHAANAQWKKLLEAQVMWGPELTARTGGPFGLVESYVRPHGAAGADDECASHAAQLMLGVIDAFAAVDDRRWNSAHASARVALAPLASQQWWAFPDVGRAPEHVYCTKELLGRLLSFTGVFATPDDDDDGPLGIRAKLFPPLSERLQPLAMFASQCRSALDPDSVARIRGLELGQRWPELEPAAIHTRVPFGTAIRGWIAEGKWNRDTVTAPPTPDLTTKVDAASVLAMVDGITFPLNVPLGFDAAISSGNLPWHIARAELLPDSDTVRWSIERAPYGTVWVHAAETALHHARVALLNEQASCFMAAFAHQLGTALDQDVTVMPTKTP